MVVIVLVIVVVIVLVLVLVLVVMLVVMLVLMIVVVVVIVIVIVIVIVLVIVLVGPGSTSTSGPADPGGSALARLLDSASMTPNDDDARRARAAQRRSRLTGRVTSLNEAGTREFDLAFWAAQPAGVKFAAIWQLTLEGWHLAGHSGEPRLDRSAGRVFRRGG